ncbi:MAG TPA: ribose-phosphate diphosphokinase [Pseudolabrys sp.]|nr:ribose-phosphate diphosphokinase [Pseudolabrys sp.]
MSALIIQSLPSSSVEAARLAARLGLVMREIDVHHFPDGELRVTAGPAAPTTLIYASLDRPNDKLLTILFAAEALRRGGARRLVLLAPYLCYMRQDAAFTGGEAISQKVVGRLLADAVDRIITVDAHLHRTKTIREIFPGIAADNLSAMPAVADAMRQARLDPRTIIVGPDAESRSWVSDLAHRLALPYVVAEKTRRDDHTVQLAFADPAVFSGRPALLVDDIVSSGSTITAGARALAAAGAYPIDVVVTHALFPAQLTEKLLHSGIRSILSTYSVPHPSNAIRLDGLLADALQSEIDGLPGRAA